MKALLQFGLMAKGMKAGAGADRLLLSEHDVDVWRIALDEQPADAVDFMAGLLSSDETDRASRFYFERDRRRFVVGRGVLRMTLGRYLGRHPQELAFCYGPNGKPALVATAGQPIIHFNLAHSEGLAVFACTRVGEVGIDVEFIRDLTDWEQVAAAVFSDPELARLQACPAEQRRKEFFRAWTRQEAVLKALGTGLAGAADAATESAFKVYPLEVAPGFAGAFAASPAVRCPTQVLEWTGPATAARKQISSRNTPPSHRGIRSILP